MCAAALNLESPAKINLYLKILRRREDGFHDLVTLFERISLCDHICLKKLINDKIVIRCSHKDVPLGPKNLVYRIAQTLKKDFNIREGVEIVIKKNIPVAAGLAGGSSNAATTLLGLNRLWNLKLSRKQLLNYARQVGSDVAFFLYDASWGLGTQRGDKIKTLALKSKLWHVIVVPKIKLLAKDIYQAYQKLNTTKTPPPGGTNLLTDQNSNVTILLRQLRKNALSDLSSGIFNSLEAPVLWTKPQLSQLKKKLNSLQAQGVMVSGSGPAVFGLFGSEQQAKNAAKILVQRYQRVFVVRTL